MNKKNAKRKLIKLQNMWGKKLGKQMWTKETKSVVEKRPERWGFK